MHLATDMTALAVLEVVDGYLISQGFAREGKDGYDALTGADNSRGYVREPIEVVVSINRPNEVPMRVNENTPEFDAVGMVIFDELRHRLEQRWPGKVEAIP